MAITILLVVLTLVVTISDGLMGQPNFGFGELFPEMEFKKPKISKFKGHDHFGSFHAFDSIGVKPIIFEPMDINKIRNRVPSSGEQFKISSQNSHYSYSNNNGEEKSEGGIAEILNINGDVRERVGLYKTDP